MNAPITLERAEDVIGTARLTERRLRAAATRAEYPHVARRCRQLGRYLAGHRHAHVKLAAGVSYRFAIKGLAGFLRDWGPAIDSECRAAARPALPAKVAA